MLHRLPNEILLKILEKTKSKTVKECRLLNSQFDNLIQKFQLHLQKIDQLIITKFYDEEYGYGLISREPEFRHHRSSYYKTYEEILTDLNMQLKKVQSVKRFEFLRISINENLIRVFNNQRWLRKLANIRMLNCNFDRNSEPYWFSFLSKLRLNVLCIMDQSIEAATGFTFPKTILNNVRSEFLYGGEYTGDASEIPWMDDSLLENYIDSGKTIWVDYAFTSYTLGGVEEFLKELSKSGRSITWVSGIMKNVTAYEMNTLLNKMKAEYQQHDKHQENIYISFSVSKLGAKQNIYMRAVRNLKLN